MRQYRLAVFRNGLDVMDVKNGRFFDCDFVSSYMPAEVNLSEDRENRYRDKLDVLYERLDDIETWRAPGVDQLLEHRRDRFALFKAFQEAMEVITDICAMYLADTGRGLGDDRENIQKSAGNLFSDEIAAALLEANGLRNRVVHDYDDFEDRTALESIETVSPGLSRFEQEVRTWLDSQ